MALSVQTSEGPLYEVDMQLRPSGKKGPVAVRFSSFETYYQDEAWIWEFQALTRLAPIAGDKDFCEKIKVATQKNLKNLKDKEKIIPEVINMRQKMRDNLRPRGDWDLKRKYGGIIDLEFLTQAYQLLYVVEYPDIIDANTINALNKIGEHNLMPHEEIVRLINAGEVLGQVRQILAIISGADFDEESATIATKKAIAHALNEPDFQMAKAQINAANDVIKSAWENLEKM